MAILKGFPPSNTISASVRIKETDLSFYDVGSSFHRAGLVGFASKGPINLPTQIRTRRELTEVFGYPHPQTGDPYLLYAATQYLAIANELWIVRVAEENNTSWEQATTAEIEVPAAGGQIIITSNVASPTALPVYSFAVDSFFRWRLNTVLSSKTLLVYADANRPAPLTGDKYSCLQLVEDLNLQLTDDDGIEFFCTTGNEIGVRTTFAFGPDASLELVSVKDAIYGGSTVALGGPNVTGLGTGMTRAQVLGTTTGYPDPDSSSLGVADTWDLTSETDVLLEIVVDGTDSTSIDQVVQVVDLGDLEGITSTTDEVVDEINEQIASLPGGFVAIGGDAASVPTEVSGDPELAGLVSLKSISIVSLHHGVDAALRVKPGSSGAPIFGFPTAGPTQADTGVSPAGVSGDASIDTYGIVVGDAAATGDVTFSLAADSPGIDGNNTQVVITNDLRQGTFTLEVYNNSTQTESWGNLTKDATSRFYVESFLSIVSNWVRVTDDPDNPASPADGTYDLAGGSDGIPADPDDQDDLIIGDLYEMTGLYALSEPEQVDIDLLAAPGHSSTSVMEGIIDVCQNERMDCLGILDPPFGLYLQEIVDWHNGRHPLNDTRLDSDFAALYWPWLKQFDSFNQVDVWVPPSGSVLATIARSDSLSAPWYAPAGASRGQVPNVKDVFQRPTLAERDLLYGWRNAVNPIVQFRDIDGFVAWGQKTLQRTPTALDRINVRRMMFVAEKRIRADSRRLLFDPHDDIFHSKFITIASRVLDTIRSGRGLTDYRIQADWDINTPDRVDRNEFWARIGIQPTKAVEFIFIEFSIHRTGSFEYNSDYVGTDF